MNAHFHIKYNTSSIYKNVSLKFNELYKDFMCKFKTIFSETMGDKRWHTILKHVLRYW